MKPFVLLLLLLLSGMFACAQDRILLKNGDEIKANILEITDSEIVYKAWNGKNDILWLTSSDIFSINYKNGDKDIFTDRQQSAKSKIAVGYPYISASKSYKPGDLFEEGDVRGLVVSTNEDGRHGLILSLEQARLTWSAEGAGMIQLTLGLSDRADGWNNRCKLVEWMSSGNMTWDDFPAAQWCESLGSGWYLPAIDEVKGLWALLDGPTDSGKITFGETMATARKFNGWMQAYGGQKLSSFYPVLIMWSSTEKLATTSFICDIGINPAAYWTGQKDYPYKTQLDQFKENKWFVRAVHKF